ncbi:alpha/beta-hydrolase [Neolentinus lepideus HHB14362 ss-1]|uniref:Alpha/beta-hydrolase n=1 Tax=Neolentinus lepideus HHB14362 ss-1 TaxID=1314782 RepID=A0A165RTC7_9AGAM|nr:alpha/beta-hydrolase [Neolentinus lepideus HHB14362 ss-1]
MVLSLRHQPLKGLYLTHQALTTVFINLPLWTIIYLPPFLRPRRGWSLLRTLRLKVLQKWTKIAGRTGPIARSPDHLALVPGAKGDWVEPVPEKFVLGGIQCMAVAAGVSPVRLPGYWLDKEGSEIPLGKTALPGEQVLYHLHGGGYTDLSANPNDPTAAISRGMLQHSKNIQRVFSIEYRLSTATTHSFPTALIDALTGYYYLLHTVGFAAEDIIVEGDSAGGNLALSLVRYLVEHRNQPGMDILPPPGRLVLMSPWVDLSTFHETHDSSFFTCLTSDYLTHTGVHKNVATFVGPFGSGAAEVNPYISPASLHPALKASFKGFPRTFIAAGGAEILRDQIHVLKDRMVRDLGEETVAYYESPDAVHDYAALSFYEPERTHTFAKIAEWLAS